LAARCSDIAGGFLCSKSRPFERAASEGKNEKEFYMNPHKEAYKQLL